MLFRVLAGRHTAAGQVYCKDDVVDSDRDLVALFGDTKFKREIELEMAKASSAPSPKKAKQKKETKVPKAKDVSANFEEAGEFGLIVTKIGRKYFVAQEDEPDTIVNKTPLKFDEVEEYISDNFEAA